MTKGAQTRTRLLEHAAKLLQSKGYHATGINQLAGADVPKGSIYFHFPGGKEELAAEALCLSGNQLESALRGVLASVEDAGEAVARVVRLLGQRLAETEYCEGCPVATVTLEVAHESTRLRQVCADIYEGWEAALRAKLFAAGLEESHAHELATFCLAAIEGALVLARARQSVAPLTAVGNQLRRLITAQSTP